MIPKQTPQLALVTAASVGDAGATEADETATKQQYRTVDTLFPTTPSDKHCLSLQRKVVYRLQGCFLPKFHFLNKSGTGNGTNTNHHADTTLQHLAIDGFDPAVSLEPGTAEKGRYGETGNTFGLWWR